MSDLDEEVRSSSEQNGVRLKKLEAFHARVDATCRYLKRFTRAEFREKFGFIDPHEYGYKSLKKLFVMRGCEREEDGIFTYNENQRSVEMIADVENMLTFFGPPNFNQDKTFLKKLGLFHSHVTSILESLNRFTAEAFLEEISVVAPFDAEDFGYSSIEHLLFLRGCRQEGKEFVYDKVTGLLRKVAIVAAHLVDFTESEFSKNFRTFFRENVDPERNGFDSLKALLKSVHCIKSDSENGEEHSKTFSKNEKKSFFCDNLLVEFAKSVPKKRSLVSDCKKSNTDNDGEPVIKKMKKWLKSSQDSCDLSTASNVPFLLDLENRYPLSKIANQLDPKSFIHLASTCKTLHDYCFNSGEVKVPYGNLWMSVYDRDGVYCFKLAKKEEDLNFSKFSHESHEPLHYTGKKLGFLGSSENRKKLMKYPFVFKLEELHIAEYVLDEHFIAALRTFFSTFPIKSVATVSLEKVEDWDGFLQFLKDYNVANVCKNSGCVWRISQFPTPNHPIPGDIASYILQNMVCYNDRRRCISDSLILKSSVVELTLSSTKISRTTFKELFMRFANSTEKINWTLGRQDFEFGHYNLFKVISCYHKGPLPDERPLVFIGRGEIEDFFILRKDGKVLNCHDYRSEIKFSTERATKSFFPLSPAESDEDIDEEESDEDIGEEESDEDIDEEESDEDIDEEESDEDIDEEEVDIFEYLGY